jgi:hypothetical protein
MSGDGSKIMNNARFSVPVFETCAMKNRLGKAHKRKYVLKDH